MDTKRITKTTRALIRSYVEIAKEPVLYGDECASGYRLAIIHALIADTACMNYEASAYIDEQLAKTEE